MKKKKNKKNKKSNKTLLVEKQLNQAQEKREKLENDINEILDELTVEELTELENMGDFSKEAIEWIRMRKRLKKAKKAQEDFEKRIRVSDEIIRRSLLMGKLAGIRNGDYKPRNKNEEELLKALLENEPDVVRGEREKDKERLPGDSRSKSSGGSKEQERER